MSADSPTPSEKHIFLAALDIAEAGREAFLESACRGHPAVRARVDMLLRTRAASEGFLSEPLTETPATLRREMGAHVGYFGDYELLDEIARGASGVVYRARQLSLGRLVALKMLREHLPGSDAAKRFRAEAQAAAALDHANIVPIYEVGEHEGQSFLSMKFIDGGTLGSRAEEVRTDPKHAVRLMVKVARAVEVAHTRGLLHRDIKPGNILLDVEGEPMVTDFGIARRIGQDSELTQTGQVMGTPYYMAPEQARGETVSLTPQADVYALGAVLYELLSGRRPFEGGGMIEVLRRVVEETPEPMRAVNAALPRELEAIVARCMEKQPSMRYATAAELAEDLERWLRGEPIRARPAGAIVRFVKWTRRSPARAALIFLGILLAGSWAGFANWVASRPKPVPQVAVVEKKTGFEPGGDFVKSVPGRTMDILRLIEIVNPTVLEVWRKEGGDFVGKQSGKHIALSLPMHAVGDYDLHAEFTLSDFQEARGNMLSLLSVPVGTQSAQIVLGSASGCRCVKCWRKGGDEPLATLPGVEHPFYPVSGLRELGGKPLVENGTAIFHHTLEAGPHTLDVRVRLQKDTASLVVELDGKPFIAWQGALGELPSLQKNARQQQGPQREFFFIVWNPANYTIRYTRMTFTPLTGDAWVRLPGVPR